MELTKKAASGQLFLFRAVGYIGEVKPVILHIPLQSLFRWRISKKLPNSAKKRFFPLAI